jgi:hypothetical protein
MRHGSWTSREAAGTGRGSRRGQDQTSGDLRWSSATRFLRLRSRAGVGDCLLARASRGGAGARVLASCDAPALECDCGGAWRPDRAAGVAGLGMVWQYQRSTGGIGGAVRCGGAVLQGSRLVSGGR